MENAAERLVFEAAAWNSHSIDSILEGYADNAEIRDGVNFISGKDEFAAFLKSTLTEKQDYKLKLDLWGALKGRMAVRFVAEWRDVSGQWYRSYGVQLFQFNDEGLAEKRYASQESITIGAEQRELL
jgi:nuclear transport factor 2 (NTF2) superfamily protein